MWAGDEAALTPFFNVADPIHFDMDPDPDPGNHTSD